ncbi:MAG TPA: hypothetical protein DIU39_04185 [Flavobacteriales bacterium]|mgnify:CR=1|nr:hypothetical protein [Flavobacteriales bacterium]|tara:strand:- start:8355 stop:9038 length:684 start_codon:yes stop_codon:yes gene_type:complete
MSLLLLFIIIALISVGLGYLSYRFLNSPAAKLSAYIVLIGLNAFVGYKIYDSIESEIKFREETERRKAIVVERLKQIREAQVVYKSRKGEYAKNFEQLTNFLRNDSIQVIYSVGDLPDSLLGQEAKAIELGIITRDTTLIPVRDTLFKQNFDMIVDSLPYIPFSGGKKFNIDAGEIESGKVKVKVFEVSASLGDIYRGLDIANKNIDTTEVLKVGSMQEATLNGNWE